MPETEGEPYGVLFFYNKRLDNMAIIETFETHQQLINKLITNKNLIITDLQFAENKLKEYGYFNIIGGYKTPFTDASTRQYINNTTFEDIYALYQFDVQLKKLFLSYLCQIERKIAVSIAYAFTEVHGNDQSEYLDINNYNNTLQNIPKINKLINILQNTIHNTQHEYINHQRTTKGNVPLRILVNALTMGNISNLYALSNHSIRSKVSHNFTNVNERQLEQYLKVLVMFRNICAHNERLYSSYAHSEIPNTILHKKLKIPQTGTQYIYGKRDLFSLVIAFRYLLPKEDFLIFKKDLARIIKQYLKDSHRLTEAELLKYMGFPQNWKDITRYKI